MERVKIIQTGNENQAKENRNLPKNLITCAKYRLKTSPKLSEIYITKQVTTHTATL